MPTVVELLRRRVGTQPATQAYHFVDDITAGEDGYAGGEPPASGTSISYRELDRAARGIAAVLAERGVVAGRPVLLLYPPGLDYVAGFLGCLYAGAVAVPAYPPEAARWHRTLPRLRGLVADCGATVALTTSALAGAAAAAPAQPSELAGLAGLAWIATDTLPAGAADTWVPPDLDRDHPALLQYTSGSTGTPRGVLLSHANLLHNAGLVQAAFGTSPDTVGVSWLPPYHDMGLIGGILQPLYAGFPVTLMSPLTFLRRPLAWLAAVAGSGATMSGGPTFAFDLCVRRSTPQQRAALDLSRWRLAFCGAEPVRAETLDRFAAAFAPAGFRPDAFYPCYGLAEATLIVTGGRGVRRSGATGASGCGWPIGDEQRLVIADPQAGTACPPGTEGEIWLAGPSVAQGYWGRPDQTAETFGARLAGDPDRRYLRTGDLGFLDPTGELVVTGRIKDLIIVRGRNLHPADLEQAVERDASGLRPGGTAAFPVLVDGEERLGLAGELAPGAGADLAGVLAAVRQAVTEAAQVAPAVVVLLRPGRLPKTSSGKIQRYACRQALERGDWQPGAPGVLAHWNDSGPDARMSTVDSASVTGLVATALGVPPEQLPSGTPLTALGLDSLRAIELQGALQTRLGLPVSLSDLLTGSTVDDLRSQQGSPLTRTPVIGDPSAEPGEPAASDGQRAMWLLQRWAPDSTAYQISRAARVRSRLDLPALDRALRAVLARHPVLRTRMPARGGEPVVEVAGPDEWDGPVLARHDLTGATEPELRERVQADADRRFDLERGPLFRASLFTRGPADHVLLLSLHHTITDFWSLSVLVDEVLTHYTTGSVPGPAPPPGYPVARRGADRQEQSLAYWREELAAAPPALELPTSFPRPRLQSFRGATATVRLPAAALRRLDALAGQIGTSRFAVLAAGYAAVLARHAGQEEVVIGTPTADRDGGQHHSLGYLTNPVPLRVPVAPGGSLRELAGTVRRVLLGALDHPVPFPTLVHALRPVRDPGRSPLVQTMLVLQQPPSGRPDLGAFAVADETAELDLGGLTVAPYRLAEHGSPYDLAVTFAEVGGDLVGWVSYCADLFDPPAMARLLRHLTTLLDRAGAEPDRPLAAIDLLDGRERAEVLAMGTGPADGFPDRATLPELFAQQVARRPEATAVVAGDRTLSYAELDRRAGALAALLRRQYRVRRGSLVGVYAPRGPEAIVAFWAALQAGAAYLPLPPDHPPARLAWLLADARPAVVLTCREVAGRLPDGGPPRVHLDEPLPPAPAAATPEPPAAELSRDAAGPEDVAYVVYTSGSTGRPKGVMVGHRAACNLYAAQVAAFRITETSRVLQISGAAFDVHLADILDAHLTGAQLHIPPPEATVPGPALAALLAQARITFICLTPSMLGALPDAALPDLRLILVGGEACPPELVARWAPGREFYNAYGPAETTVCISWGRCQPQERRRPPIGWPIPNVQLYVLDARMRPVPVGVPGELHIGGVCVGEGYLGRPELTAQRFLPDPFASRPGGRLYRTGDRVRWLADGSLDFLGRLDDQVKIRGVRIEPGEVEVRLRELSGARAVAVVPTPGPVPGGAAGLVAYLVAAPEQRRSPAELRSALRAELPEPWVPAAYVYLDALPRGPSGKLDRQALPAPTAADRGVAGDRTAPRGELERVVAGVWEAVLEQSEVGVRDHFFDELGGSSLVVARVTSELSRQLAREVPVTWLFEHPTVEALARRLADQPDPEPAGPAPEEQAARRRRALARRAKQADQDSATGSVTPHDRAQPHPPNPHW